MNRDFEFAMEILGFSRADRKYRKIYSGKKYSVIQRNGSYIFSDCGRKVICVSLSRLISTAERYIFKSDNSPIFARSAREMTSDLVRVRSSNVWAYGMDIKENGDKTGTPYVQFKDRYGGAGDIYCYYDVPVTLYRNWQSAPSKGHFFWLYIRPWYQYSKLTGDKHGKLPNAVS